jgi:ribosome-associated translation inhibitor RaiA
MAKNRENMGGPTQRPSDPPTEDRDNAAQPAGMSAQSQSGPIGDEERSNRDGDPLSDHGVSRLAGPPEPDAEPEGEQQNERPIDVLLNTDSSIEGNESLTAEVEAAVNSALARFSSQMTRVEVHLSDQNAGKSGSDDKRCMIEARLEGLQPIAVTATSDNLSQAIDGATDKLKRSIESTLGRLRDRRLKTPDAIIPDITSS